jgi:fibronectin type 3 domain-containing protein
VSVLLNWAVSSSSGVVGYNVYRSSVSGGPYAKLVSSPVAGTSYTDNTVQAGEYYYVVTSVESNGTESTYSNQAAVDVP